MKIHWDFVFVWFECGLIITALILGVMGMIGFEMGIATYLFAALIGASSAGYQIIEARYDYENDKFDWKD